MLARTKGFENGQNVEIYEKDIITNQGDVDLAKKKRDPGIKIPKLEDKTVVYIKAGTPQGKSSFEGPLKEKHEKSFPKTLAAFKAGKANANSDGVPLEALRDFAAGVLSVYEESGIHTLEAIKEINSNEIEHFPMGRKVQDQAVKILASMNSEGNEANAHKIGELTAAFESFRDDTEENQKVLSDENTDLKAQLAAANKRAEKAENASEKTGKSDKVSSKKSTKAELEV